MFPLEFTFEGPPLSSQSKSSARKASYRTKIQTAVQQVLAAGTAPSTDSVEIQITYYYEGDTPDVDNIIKPIQDALKGLVYVDDNQVTDTRSRKKDINGSYKIRAVSSTLLQAFSSGNDFVHVKINRHTPNQNLD